MIKEGKSDIKKEFDQLTSLIKKAWYETSTLDIMNSPITVEEVNLTFRTCTGSPGPD